MARDPTYVSLPDRWGVLPLDQEEEIYFELRLPKGETTSAAPSEAATILKTAAVGRSATASTSTSTSTSTSSDESSDSEADEEGGDDFVIDLRETGSGNGHGDKEQLLPETETETEAAETTETKEPPKRALLVMGAFASLRWLDCLADRLAAEGFEVVSYNHRGIPLGSYVDLSAANVNGDGDGDGPRSRASSTASADSTSSSSTTTTTTTTGSSTSSSDSGTGKRRPARLGHHHTCEQLARDAWRLIEHVWGEDSGGVHIYGASMGGFIAQQMALLELAAADAARRPPRVASLFLAVTCRGPCPIPGMDEVARRLLPLTYRTGLIRLALPLLVGRSKERMLQHLLGKCFRAEYLQSTHAGTGEPMRDVWARAWGENWEDWSTFACPEACANQLMTIASFYLSDADAARLKKRVAPITVQVATHDAVVPTFMQETLAGLVGARTLYVEGGHMLDTVEEERFWRDTMEHFREAPAWAAACCGSW